MLGNTNAIPKGSNSKRLPSIQPFTSLTTRGLQGIQPMPGRKGGPSSSMLDRSEGAECKVSHDIEDVIHQLHYAQVGAFARKSVGYDWE